MHVFETQLMASWPPSEWANVTVLVAVSGGADSVALLQGLHRIRESGEGRLVVAHYNHGLRGVESDADEAFVRELSQSLGIECRCQRHSTSTAAPRTEEAARHSRYAFLQQTAADVGARYVVTAHTADDQAETILHRILRGTGISGLTGIPRSRELLPGVALLRPMLEVRRNHVAEYLNRIGQSHRDDASNDDPCYTRNRIRNSLLPTLASEFNPEVASALIRLGRQAGEVHSLLEQLAAQLASQAVIQRSARRVTISCTVARSSPRVVIRQCLLLLWRGQGWPEQAMGFRQWDDLAGWLLDDSPADRRSCITLPGGIIATHTADHLEFVAR